MGERSLIPLRFDRMKESRSKTRASVAVGSEKEKPLNTPISANPTPSQSHLTAPPAKPESTNTPNTASWRLPTMFTYSPAPPKLPTPADLVKGGMVTSTGASSKSQGVMDWFRKKSLAKQERRRADTGRAEGTKTPTPDDPQMEKDAKTPTVSSFREAQAARSGSGSGSGSGAPAVVVTAENGSVYSGGSQGSGGSRKRDKVIEAIRTVATPTSLVPMPVPISGSPTRPAPAYNKLALRPHDGPVDPSTLFSAPPAEIVAHVLGILRAMGIESIKESEFKYRCIRPKRKKSGMVVREASGSSNGIAAFNSVGSAASNGVSVIQFYYYYFLVELCTDVFVNRSTGGDCLLRHRRLPVRGCSRFSVVERLHSPRLLPSLPLCRLKMMMRGSCPEARRRRNPPLRLLRHRKDSK